MSSGPSSSAPAFTPLSPSSLAAHTLSAASSPLPGHPPPLPPSLFASSFAGSLTPSGSGSRRGVGSPATSPRRLLLRQPRRRSPHHRLAGAIARRTSATMRGMPCPSSGPTTPLSLLAITVSSSRSSPPSGSRHSTASSQTRDDPTPTMLALRAVNDGGRKPLTRPTSSRTSNQLAATSHTPVRRFVAPLSSSGTPARLPPRNPQLVQRSLAAKGVPRLCQPSAVSAYFPPCTPRHSVGRRRPPRQGLCQLAPGRPRPPPRRRFVNGTASATRAGALRAEPLGHPLYLARSKLAPAAGHGTPSSPRMDTLWGPRAGPEL